MTIKTLRRIFGIAAVLVLVASIVWFFIHGKSSREQTTDFALLNDGSSCQDEQSWHGRYSSEGDNPRQSLWVEATGDSLIFKYSVAFPDGGQPSTIVGKVAAKGGDAELDEDENGCAYLVDEYIYEKEGDWFAFRIDADSQSSVRVKADKATSAKYRIPESTLLLRTEPKKE